MKKLFLTFDDGPDPFYTPRLLDLLAKYQIKATFFVLGERAQQYPHIVQQIALQHEIGHHTWDHTSPLKLSDYDACYSVDRATQYLEDLLGRSLKLWRPPFGHINKVMVSHCQTLQQKMILWDQSAIDWGLLGVTPLIKRRLRKAYRRSDTPQGQVVLLHDTKNRQNQPERSYTALAQFLRESAQSSSVEFNSVDV